MTDMSTDEYEARAKARDRRTGCAYVIVWWLSGIAIRLVGLAVFFGIAWVVFKWAVRVALAS